MATRNGGRLANNNRLQLQQNVITNLLLDRSLLLKRLIDPRRDIDTECGHPTEIQIEDYKRAFLRGDVANRVVSVLPEECWADRPEVYETEDEQETDFEGAWKGLEERLALYSLLQRADTLSGIGRYGVILLGLDDGKPLDQPVSGIDEKGDKVGNSKLNLLYVRAFDESFLTISEIEGDLKNPRYGLPKFYQIQFNDIAIGTTQGGSTATTELLTARRVHWSRIVHVADNRTSSEVYGLPRMEKVFNRLLDLKKIAGGSGEMFWKGGFPGLSLENQDGAAELDLDATRDQLEAYMNGLQRYLAVTGLTAKSLAPQVADPSNHVDAQLKLIAMAIGVPWRIFAGSEASRLASEQDTRAWNRRLMRRRTEYLNPFLIRPFLERLIAFGTLPEPQGIYVDWPDPNTLSDNDKADNADKRTNALSKYTLSGADVIFPPYHYLTLVMGYTDAEAKSVIEAADKEMKNVAALPPPPGQVSAQVPGQVPGQPTVPGQTVPAQKQSRTRVPKLVPPATP